MDVDVLQIVSGMAVSDLTLQPAVVNGFKRRLVRGESFPMLVAAPEDSVNGVLVHGLTDEALQRAQFFEGEEYALKQICVSGLPESHTSIPCVGETEAVYFADNAVYQLQDEDWSIRHWQADKKTEFLLRLARYMEFFGELTAAEADQHW